MIKYLLRTGADDDVIVVELLNRFRIRNFKRSGDGVRRDDRRLLLLRVVELVDVGVVALQ